MKKTFFMSIAIFLCINKASAQILEQRFNSGETVSKYFNNHQPRKNQFTFISNYGSQRSSITNGALRFYKTGISSGQLTRSVNFNNNPDFLYISFKYTLSENQSTRPTDLQGVFFVGTGFTDDAVSPIDVHSKFSFHYTGSGTFKLRDMSTNTYSSEFSGTQTITFVVNNSGNDRTYTSPIGTNEVLGNDKWDLWVGNHKVFDEGESIKSDVPLNNIKFEIPSSSVNAIVDLDDIIIHDYQTLNAPSAEPEVEDSKYINYKKQFTVTKPWLKFPVKNKYVKRNVLIESKNETFREFSIELPEGEPDWYAYVDISSLIGKTITIVVDSLPLTSDALNYVNEVDTKSIDETIYKEQYRGQIHYSVKRGWNNDPNGMVYYNGEYHLFYQYNPYGTSWGNMHWGHAISKDLIYWEEQDVALYPDKYGFMYSGGGVVDIGNSSGLSQNGTDPLMLFYTITGPPRVQGLAYSIDGKTFKKLDKPILGQIKEGNRDPKVFWYEPTNKWIMVLYVEDNSMHTMRFFSSSNMIDWAEEGTYSAGIGTADKYMYECPEFYELPVEGITGVKKWILVGADGQYAVGSFDGHVFTPEHERLKSVLGTGYYAGQQFSNEPNGRKIEMGWYRTNTDQVKMNFSQSLSIPMEIKLKNTPDGLRIFRMPVQELQSLRKKSYQFASQSIGTGFSKNIGVELQEMKATIATVPGTELTINLRGVVFTYRTATSELTYRNQTVIVPLQEGKLRLHAYMDRTGVELFVNDGLMFVPANVNMNAANTEVKFSVQGGSAIIETLELYELGSIFNKEDTNVPDSYGKLFEQDFQSGTVRTDFIGRGEGLFNSISNSTNSLATIETENGNNFMRFDKKGGASYMIRNATFSNTSSIAVLKYKFRFIPPDVEETPTNDILGFLLGDETSAYPTSVYNNDNTGNPESENVFANVNLRVLKSDGSQSGLVAGNYYVYASATGTYFSSSEWLEITLVANRTNTVLPYRGPNGTNYNLPAGKQDAWIGTTRVLNSGTLSTNAELTTFNKFKVRIPANFPNGKIDIDDIRIYGDISVLPVTLTSFTGAKQGSTVELQWSTASEKNNSHFEILRSDNSGDFRFITTVRGREDSGVFENYSYIDFNPINGNNYYKLRQVDFDDTVNEYPKIVAVNIEDPTENLLFNTLENGSVNIVFHAGQENVNGKITITDILGRQLASKKFKISKGYNEVEMETYLQKGIYVVSLYIENKKISAKFIK